VRVPRFLAAPLAVADSDHIVTIPSRLVHMIGPLRRFAIHKPPLRLVPFTVRQFWHERNEHDPAHSWLRVLMREIAATTGATQPRSVGRPRLDHSL
jgi:hypothetical protein